ncbi:MAG: hypothetical protein QNJ98_05140 [Planctomycetota bacterium]|nr:hypothetical protein [Planctomycetota bacterium]
MADRMRPFTALAFAVVLALAAAPLAAEEGDLEARLAAIAKQSGPDAIAALEALLESVTDPAAKRLVRETLAVRFVKEGNAYAALEHYETLVREGATDLLRVAYGEALVMTARTNLASGNATAAGVVPYLTDARNAVQEVEAADDADLRGRLVRVRAESWYYAGEMKNALEALAPDVLATLEAPHTGVCWQLRAQALYRTGDMVGAAEAFERGGNARGAAASWSAAKDGPRTVKAYVALLKATPQDLALLREAISAVRYAGGVAELEAALVEVPVEGAWKARYLVARADLLEASGKTDEAIPLLQEAAALDTALVDPLIRIARIHLADITADPGVQRGKAVDVLLEALTRDPAHKDVASSLWHLAGLDYQGLWKSAATGPGFMRSVRVQRALLETAPDDALGWGNLGNTLRVGGQTDEALAAYERARRENAYDPTIVSDHGLALSAAGRFEAALEAYLASVAMDDGHLAGRQNAGRALWLTGRDDEAETQLSTAGRKARHLDRNPMTFRFLLDRVWRTRQDESLR